MKVTTTWMQCFFPGNSEIWTILLYLSRFTPFKDSDLVVFFQVCHVFLWRKQGEAGGSLPPRAASRGGVGRSGAEWGAAEGVGGVGGVEGAGGATRAGDAT